MGLQTTFAMASCKPLLPKDGLEGQTGSQPFVGKKKGERRDSNMYM